MDTYNIYKDINLRTDGEIYIGVVGPVRCGKSTFIKRFAEKMILPYINDENIKERTKDELPQSAAGKTVMTTEPKFIPRQSCTITPMEDVSMNIRLIDCVGFMVDGANGVNEDGNERLVKTPWYDYEIPFSEAAEFGTKKVIKDHSTIGIVMTTDGTVCDIPADNYKKAQENTINELKKIGKPFVVVVNSKYPDSQGAIQCVEEIKNNYNTEALSINCDELSLSDINRLFELMLGSFPVSGIEFHYDRWAYTLPDTSEIKKALIECSAKILDSITYVRDINKEHFSCEYVDDIKTDPVDMSNGVVKVTYKLKESLYYEMLSKMSGEVIDNEYSLIKVLKEYAQEKNKLSKYAQAIDMVRQKGYGVVTPSKEEISISEPEVIKNGGRYGVKLRAESPSYHMIRVNIETEIAPIVGNEQQANDLKKYIDENTKSGDAWDINIFGKTIEQLVDDGIRTKLTMMNDDCQIKLMDTMKKVVNDNSGGIVCLII